MSRTAQARRDAILQRVTDAGFADIASLQTEFGYSEATIRRDLQALEEAGHLRRTHGGAVIGRSGHERLSAEADPMTDAKERIARAAVLLVQPDSAIGFTGGTTTQQVARRLAHHDGLTVVTNALNVAMQFADDAARVIVTGGEMTGPRYELVGPFAEPVLSQIHLDLMFVGVDGLSIQAGLTTQNPAEARINRLFLDHASKVVVVADHTKLGVKQFAQIAPVDAAHCIITDSGAPLDVVRELEQLGLDVAMV